MKRGGFTLLEMIVAAVIGSLVGLTAVATLYAISDSRGKIESTVSVSSELRYATEMIEADLANMYRDREFKNVKLVGEYLSEDGMPATRLVLHTVSANKARPDQPESDVYEVDYYLLEREGKTALMRRVWPYPQVDAEPKGILYPVAEHITGFQLRFYDGVEWLPEWPETSTSLPDLVEINMTAQHPEYKHVIFSSVVTGFPRWPGSKKDVAIESDSQKQE